jgi:hypothetical protein
VTFSDYRGFNYSGSWGTSGVDLWLRYDAALLREEVARGKRYFPGWNSVRWWLSYEGFQRDPQRFLANFEDGLGVFAEHGLAVMPVLFNRWRAEHCDFGGVWLDQIVPGMSTTVATDFEAMDAGDRHSYHAEFFRYMDAVVGAHKDDPRIFSWDLCNEPLSGPYMYDDDSPVLEAELKWLAWCRDVVKHAGAVAPVTIGNWPSFRAAMLSEPIVDLVTFHPYYIPSGGDAYPGEGAWHDDVRVLGSKNSYEAYLDKVVELAAGAGKPLIATETVWGAFDDDRRTELLRYTLGALTERGIPFMAHALHHTLVADLHAAEYGPVAGPERLEFINADGSLRKGHEAFNEFAPSS